MYGNIFTRFTYHRNRDYLLVCTDFCGVYFQFGYETDRRIGASFPETL
jgi:hypothetical protein